ncbi:MAG TPA: ABC transporter permease [Candidatus Acidoferrales bacterium]|nr:ABC transporter permease [Candidatus Acidoferrales bacterium]
MNSLLQDIRYAVRILAKAPGFTIIAIVTLALGIGANTALFSVVDGVLLNPLPYTQPDRLVAVYTHTRTFNRSSISYPNFLDWVCDNRSFSGLAAFRSDDMNMTGLGEPERLKTEMVSANFFSVLGVKPVTGRTFFPQEDQVGAAPVVLISEGIWKRKFSGSPDAVGKSVSLNGASYTIVGVVPGSFHYTSGNFRFNTDIFIPIGQWDAPLFRDRRTGMGMDAVGRLAPGVTLAQAQADMNGIAGNLANAYPDVDKGSGVAMLPLRDDVVGNIRPFLLVLLAAVGFVLLIACANVANLLLVRATGRAREFAIRAALGAVQTRVIRQLLTESVLLSLVGGVLGFLLAAWGTHAALSVLPNALPRSNEIHLNVTVLLFALGISILVGIVFGLVPALKTANPDLHETLKEGGRGGSGARHRTQNTFVVVEMALALVLLIGAGLMIRSLAVLWGVSPGYNPHNALQLNVASALPIGGSPDAVRTAFLQLHDRFATVPGVQSASLEIGSTPMQGDSEVGFWIEGQPKPTNDADMKDSLFYSVQPDYLRAMQIPLLRGRFFTGDDNQHSAPVIVIDQEFAHLAFGNENPIGKRVNLQIIGTTPEIVGVVGHVKQWGLDEGSHSPVLAQFYFPISQIPDQLMPLVARQVGGIVRTYGSPLAVVGGLRNTLEQFNSQLVMYGVQPLDEVISDSLADRKFSMILLGAFAGLALVLSAIGIYGVISYIVGQRTHEIGIRLALGAHPSDVLRLILGQGTKLALIGVVIGIFAALALTSLMTKIIFGVSAHDPLTFIGVAVVLLTVALAACYFPARRAMRTDPMVALRYE